MAILCTTYVLVASLETAGVFLQFRQLAVWYLGDSGILVCEWQPLFFRQSWRWRGVLPNLPGAYSFAPLLRLLPRFLFRAFGCFVHCRCRPLCSSSVPAAPVRYICVPLLSILFLLSCSRVSPCLAILLQSKLNPPKYL